jgi:hypothetical protein
MLLQSMHFTGYNVYKHRFKMAKLAAREVVPAESETNVVFYFVYSETGGQRLPPTCQWCFEKKIVLLGKIDYQDKSLNLQAF